MCKHLLMNTVGKLKRINQIVCRINKKRVNNERQLWFGFVLIIILFPLN